MNSVFNNFETIRKKISEINPQVTLIAVTKGQPQEKIVELISKVETPLANNYAQEGEKLQSSLKGRKISWHFIGHIQSRKTKYLVDYDWVQSFDRIEILVKLNDLLKAGEKKLNGLIEINVGNEDQKSGVSVEELPVFLKQTPQLSQIKIRGLMAMPPGLSTIEDRRPYFRQMKTLFDKHKSEWSWDTLSMGTSDDYMIAVEEGATMVRLGSCIFGARNYEGK